MDKQIEFTLNSLLEDETYKDLISREKKLLRNKFEKQIDVQGIMKRIEEFELDWDFITELSPFKVNFSSAFPGIETVLKDCYGDPLILNSLPEEQKNALVKSGISKMLLGIKRGIKALLPTGTFIEDEFLEKRLEYLIRSGSEPYEFKNSQIDCLINKIEIYLMEAHKYFFRMEDKYAMGRLTNNIEKELFYKYLINCLKEFSNMAVGHVLNIAGYYIDNLHVLTKTEIREYKVLKICPISYGLNDNKLSKFKINKLSKISKQSIAVKELVSEDGFMNVLEGFIKTSERIVTEVKNGQKLFEFESSEEYSNGLLDILDFTKDINNLLV